MEPENGGKKEGIRDGIRQGLGVLSAFKEAIEETIAEARERGDLSTDHAKDVMRGALDKAQAAAGSARDRFDFVTQLDFESLRDRMSDLASRVAALDGLAEKPREPADPQDGSGAPQSSSGGSPAEPNSVGGEP